MKEAVVPFLFLCLTFILAGCSNQPPLYDQLAPAKKVAFMPLFLDPGGNEATVSIQYFAAAPMDERGDPAGAASKVTDRVFEELKNQMGLESMYRTTAAEEFRTEREMLGEMTEVYDYENSDIDLAVKCNHSIVYREDMGHNYVLEFNTILNFYRVKGYKYPKNAGSLLGYSVITYEKDLGKFENKGLDFFLENYPYEKYIDEVLARVPEGVSSFVEKIEQKSAGSNEG